MRQKAQNFDFIQCDFLPLSSLLFHLKKKKKKIKKPTTYFK